MIGSYGGIITDILQEKSVKHEMEESEASILPYLERSILKKQRYLDPPPPPEPAAKPAASPHAAPANSPFAAKLRGALGKES